jgi:hypothetical protein
MRPVPVIFRWADVDVADADGVVRTQPAMVPMRRFENVCGRQFELGEHYTLTVDEQASSQSRRHYFACLREAWKNLPENIAHRYPTIEHMRKTALIKAGFRTERHHACSSRDEALKVAALVKDVDEFVVTVVHENVVSIYTAKSQSTHSMKNGEFQASKNAVLDLVAGLIGTTAEELAKHALPEQDKDHTRNPDHSLGEQR